MQKPDMTGVAYETGFEMHVDHKNKTVETKLKPAKKEKFKAFGWCKGCNKNRQWLYFCGCQQMGIRLLCATCYKLQHPGGIPKFL